ncbi:MAG TPA: response regulator transcription factor, partial [Bacteroidota bacterium]|nr:response regulator transcription factor [Bacteroidota bacterium]
CELARERRPDVVIMDISMPVMNGIEATIVITKESPKTKVIVLSVHSDKRYVEKIISCGAAGYLRKDCDFDELVFAIEVVLKNRLYVSPNLAGGKGSRVFSLRNKPAEITLSDREREILRRVASGKTTKEISADLNISIKTVEKDRQAIMEKFHVRRIAEVIKYAIAEGLIPLE